MGIFDLFKKKETKQNSVSSFEPLNGDSMINYIRSNLKNPTDENVLKVLQRFTEPDADMEHMKPNGMFPHMWLSVNKDVLEKTQTEYTYFLNKWIDAKNKSPKELYSALKSFVMYLEDTQKLCKAKGECFEYWFNNILIAPGYLKKRKEELQQLTDNFDELQHNYDHRKTWLSVLDNEIIKQLQANDGILQADFVKMFDECVQSDVSSKLYFMAKAGELERIKSGKSYILHYKK